MVPKNFFSLISLMFVSLSLTGCLDPGATVESEEEAMVRSSLPKTMRPVSAEQLIVDGQSKIGGRIGSWSTSLGNSIVIEQPAGGVVLAEKELVAASAGDLYPNGSPQDGNNWILSGGVVVENNDDTPRGVNNIRIRIQFGSGGVLQTAIITAAPQFVISIPSTFVKVTVFSDFAVANGTYRISAALHRGQPNGNNQSARLFTNNNEVLAGAVVGDATCNIPQFAKFLQTLGTSAAGIYGAGIVLRFEPPNSSLSYTGPELLVLKNAGTKIPIPAGATKVHITGLPGATVSEFSWDINL